MKLLWISRVNPATCRQQVEARKAHFTENERFAALLTLPEINIIVFSAMGHAVTDFLTASSSFAMGAGSAFALAGNYPEFNISRTPAEADARALNADWNITGQDIARALVREKIQSLAECEAT